MANFGQLILTSLGLQAQVSAQSGGELKFKRIAMGSGAFDGNAAILTKLVKENVSLPISNGYIQNNAYTVEGFFSNEDLLTGFEWREVGVYIEGSDGGEILYCYANAGDAYDYIPATEDERYSKYIRVAMVVGNTTNVSIVESEGIIYVDKRTFDDTVENINLAMQDHKDDNSNPHKVTAEQTGAFAKRAIELSASSDLNTLTEVGMYTYSAAAAKTIANVPAATQGTLLVLPRLTNNASAVGNRIQIVVSQNENIYVRNMIDEVWNEWRRMYKTGDTIPIEDGGTGATTAAKALEFLGAAPKSHGRHVENVCATITDWDNATTNGWYMGNNAANAPTNQDSGSLWYFGHVITHNVNYVFQEVYQFTASSDAKYIPKYIRAKKDGTWGAWVDVTVQTKVPVDAILNGAKKDLSNVTDETIQTRINGSITSKTIGPYAIELSPSEGATNGGFIDFHYGGDTSKDYTARIIEDVLGELRVIAKVKVEGDLYENSVHRVYSTGNKPTPDAIGAATASKHKLITYTALTDIGLTAGSETIAGIANAMPDGSMLVYQVDASNANIYPNKSIIVTVKRINMNRIEFLATRVDGAQLWFGNHHSSSGFTGWKEIYHAGAMPTPAQIGAAASSHNQAASTVTAGTFAGQVVANSSGQTPGTSLLRNSKLVSADTNPTVNGEICWTYE